jgi:hypothetical protein
MFAQLGMIYYQFDHDMLMCFAFKTIEMLDEFMLLCMMFMNICMNKNSIEITYAFKICKLLH